MTLFHSKLICLDLQLVRIIQSIGAGADLKNETLSKDLWSYFDPTLN
jgi:hypothetical protein